MGLTMLPANLTSALQVLSRSAKPLIAATSDASNPVTKLEPGQQLQGSVHSKISEGLFKVQVAGQTLQMRLPGNIQSGDVIKLEVIATQPRITFSMAASTNPLSTSDQIGATARILSNLAELPLERPIVQQLGNKPVWDTGLQAPDSKLLAGALREALGVSGLFYESHQAQWIRGERSTAQLLVEPQNQLTDKRLSASSTNPITQNDELYSPSPSPASHIKSAGESNLPIARELLPLVQQQLHTLETHQLTWIGQIWPGQEMQWEIQGQPPEQQAQQQGERQWSTEMELALPNLGDIHARLVFAESGLRLVLHVADTTTVELFNRALPKLKNSLADADIQLIAVVVEKS